MAAGERRFPVVRKRWGTAAQLDQVDIHIHSDQLVVGVRLVGVGRGRCGRAVLFSNPEWLCMRTGETLKMTTYGNIFQLLLERVSEDAGWVLQIVHNTRGAGLTEPELVAELDQARVSGVQRHLKNLEDLGLVVCVDSIWKTTWTGAGVSNWRTQLLSAEEGQTVAEPREGENGHHPGPECSEFRAALFAPGYCWCCRPRNKHSSEAIKAAERLLKQR